MNHFNTGKYFDFLFNSKVVRVRSSHKTKRYGNFCKDLIKRDIETPFDIFYVNIKIVSPLLENTNLCNLLVYNEKEPIILYYFKIIHGKTLYQEPVTTDCFKPKSRITAQLASIQRNFEIKLVLSCHGY